MRRKKPYLVWTATGALLGLGTMNAMGQTVNLSLQINQANNTWTAYAATDSGTDNYGLSTFVIDVVGSNGISGITSVLDTTSGVAGTSAPVVNAVPSNGDYGVGFDTLGNSNGQGSTGGGAVETPGDGIAIIGMQRVIGTENPTTDPEIVPNFGKLGAPTSYTDIPTMYSGGPTDLTFDWGSDPVALATGTYIGSSGILTVQADLSIGAGIQTLSIVGGDYGEELATTIDQSITIGAVPEPSGIGLLTLGSIAFVSRRRKARR